MKFVIDELEFTISRNEISLLINSIEKLIIGQSGDFILRIIFFEEFSNFFSVANIYV